MGKVSFKYHLTIAHFTRGGVSLIESEFESLALTRWVAKQIVSEEIPGCIKTYRITAKAVAPNHDYYM